MTNKTEFVLSPDGDDGAAGSREHPFRSFRRAAEAAWEAVRAGACEVVASALPGTYYQDGPLSIGPLETADRNASVTFRAEQPGSVTMAGGAALSCSWEPYKDGIYRCTVPEGTRFDQLFVNGDRQIRARYPNYDPSDPKEYTGYALAAGKIPDSSVGLDENDDMTFSSGAPKGVFFDPSTFTRKRWAHPETAVIHIYQAHYWGNLQWQVGAIEWDEQKIWFGPGGHQMGAKWSDTPCEVNERSYFYVENVFEELDSPGEWYLAEDEAALYYYPPEGLDLADATVEVPLTDQLVRLLGSQNQPVRNVTFEGIRFALTRSTYMEEYSIPSLSDWAIHRGGALFMQGTRGCVVKDCFFDAVGGNAVFLNYHNRDNLVTGCTFAHLGDSAVCLVGSLETTVGTQRNFSYECTVSNNRIHKCGTFGKQVAGVYISRAKRITVGHNEIFDMPRAGICIGDGTWGGHIIEHNYIHDTCRETGDHGPFNAWGRDKYWCMVQSHTEYTKDRNHFAGHVLIDAMEPVILRHNFFRETSGWGLDLDDGASNYEIYNNLCVGVSMKLREGAYRTIYNNIWVDGANSPCFHVGNEDNHDRYIRNITVMSRKTMKPEEDLNFEMGASYGEMFTLIAPPARSPWLEECDYNCYFSDLGEFVARVSPRWEIADWSELDKHNRKLSLAEWQEAGLDRHSVFAEPMFVDPSHDDYRVRPESPALKLGFENFPMDGFGITDEFPSCWDR